MTAGSLDGIAVIGLAGRFPGAASIDEFWANLCRGVESVTEFTDEQLRAAGVDAALLKDPNYVRAGVLLEGADRFDAGFFGITPREAEWMDPQHRIFLECAWEALEDAGHLGDGAGDKIGVFAGAGVNQYLLHVLASVPGLLSSADFLQRTIASDKDYLATRVAYKLNLTGPAITVQTACSTSLVAVHLACQSLLSGDCDVALAGGVSLRIPQVAGYLYRPGGIPSPDGHCRAFDAAAQGTAIGSGAAIVVLRRLEDALRDGDHIRAVILGSAVNNDGAAKVGYTAPSVDGQAAVISEAHALAGVSAGDISYVETHGTGTSLGDPIEVAALTKAFRRTTDRTGFCAIGSLKTNIGHLDAAAGCAGLIKTVLALESGLLPPSVNFRRPNPNIDFASSPFFVQQTLSPWRPASGRRVAGVSSFGIGGTNVHLVVAEPPPAAQAGRSRPWQVLTLSAKTPAALEQAAARLAHTLTERPEMDLAGAAFTLQTGRKAFVHRLAVVARTPAEAARALLERDPKRTHRAAAGASSPRLAFLFPGQGTQYPNMGRGLYECEPVFREQVDAFAERLRPALGLDIRELLFPGAGASAAAAARLTETRIAQPAVFIVEYALARLWMSWGMAPQAMAGHSLGEYVAAAVAGVFDPEDALTLVAERGRLMQALPAGAMLSAHLAEDELRRRLDGGLSVAAVNGPALSVAAGPAEAVQRLEEALRAEGIETRRLQTSHAFHSAMMDSIIEPFVEAVAARPRRAPAIPFVSGLTGAWITAAEATDPRYWGMQTRHTVRFADAAAVLLNPPAPAMIEVGAGTTLTCLVRLQNPQTLAAPSLPRVKEDRADLECILSTLGRLWAHGAPVDWRAVHSGERPQRVPLPTYPFQRERFWIEGRPQPPAPASPDPAEEPPLQEAPSGGPAVPAPHSRPSLGSDYAAPANHAERELARIWEQALGVRPIGVDDDFFDLGGHSLLALTILGEVERVFGKRLLLATLVEAPTIRRFAALLGEPPDARPLSCVVPLSPGGAAAPLFLMHSHGGNILEYVPLAHRLGSARPVFAVQARGLFGPLPEQPRIEEMAADYLREIRAVQPRGPYYLAGFCFGGYLALEAAHQLRAQGEHVALLALLDSATGSYPVYRPGTTPVHRACYGIWRRLELEWSSLAAKPPSMRPAHAAARLRRLRDIGQTTVERVLNRLRARFGWGAPACSEAHRLQRLAEAHDRAWAAYSPRPYDGRVLLVRAAKQPLGIEPDPLLGWAGLLTGALTVRQAPGCRQNMLDEPRVAAVAAALLEALEDCDRAAVEPAAAGAETSPCNGQRPAPRGRPVPV